MTTLPHSSPSPHPPATRPPDRTARIALAIVAVLVLACAAAGVALWLLHDRRIRTTDDAQVAAVPQAAAGIVVIARFKQEDVAAMRVGQPALVRLAQAPGKPLPGRVVAVGGDTAPGQSAPTHGDFVRVVQRQPVRIALDPAPAERTLFLQGMAVRVQVDTDSGR